MLQKKIHAFLGEALVDRTLAECSETGARLEHSYGRSKYGHPPKWYIDFRELWCGFNVRAWTVEEAIEAANKRLAKEYQKALRKERIGDWYEFIDLDQQAVRNPHSVIACMPDDHAKLWAQETQAITPPILEDARV